MIAQHVVRRFLAAFATCGALALGACDPCAGTASCEVGARVSYSGRVIDFASGRGASGVTVAFRRTGGAGLDADSMVAVTDAEGRFVLRAGVDGPGDVVGELSVRPPRPLAPYTVPDVRLAPSSVGGGGGVLPTFVTQPYVDYVAELRYRRTGVAMANSVVTFTRTAGAPLVARDTVGVVAGPDGWFYLEARTAGTGTVVGDLTVRYPRISRTFVVRGVSLPVRYTDRRPSLDRSFRIGTALDYVAELRYRGTQQPVADAAVEFRRTGGLPLLQSTFVGRTNAEGRLLLSLVPSTEFAGEVVGDVSVRPPPPAQPFVIRDVRVRTYDSDELPFLGILGVGFQALAAGELVFRGDRTPLADVEVAFERTGGLATTPSRVTTRSLADGRFGFALPTDTPGEVVGDVIVQVPGDPTPTRLRGLRLRALADDSVRYIGRFGVGAQLLYVGQLAQRATGTPAVGWTVTFRRTGGIPVLSETVSARVLDWGGFEIAPPTRATGEVEGVLSATPPEGGAPVALGPVRLRTQADDSVRLAGRWNVGPSLLYVGELLREDGTPIAGARVEYRRTGGIATRESVLAERTDAVGRFRLAPTPLASGDVVGELRVFPPAPLRDTVIANVRLSTFEGDEVRLRDVWRLPVPR